MLRYVIAALGGILAAAAAFAAAYFGLARTTLDDDIRLMIAALAAIAILVAVGDLFVLYP